MMSAAIIAMPLFLAPQYAFAEEQTPASAEVESIIVTAQKRPENVQDIPMSITAFGGAQLAKANISSMVDLAALVPSLQIQDANNPRNSTVFIRGIGTGGTNPGIEADVGIFIDGVYMPQSGAIFGELQDISTVEVLRGPQGTLYGGNSPVGAINITTEAPTARTEGRINIEAGNYDERRVTGVLGGQIADNLNGRITAWSDTHTGYEHNLYNNAPVNNEDQYGARVRLRWTPDDKDTFDFIAYYNSARTDGTVGAEINPYGPGGIAYGANGASFLAAAAAAVPGHPFVALGKFQVNDGDDAGDHTQIYGAAVNYSRPLPFNATLTNSLSFNEYDGRNLEQPFHLPQVLGANSQDDLIKNVADEFRVASTGDHLFNYVGGLYLSHEDLTYWNHWIFAPGSNRITSGTTTLVNPGDTGAYTYNQTRDGAALFAQTTIDLTPRFRVLVGGRYSYVDKSADVVNVISAARVASVLGPNFTQNDLKRIDHAKTWTVGVQYDLAKNVMGYATAATGFKDGGFNARATAVQTPFDPETTTTYEVGIKSKLLDRKLQVNIDGFRMLVKDFQASALNPTTGTGFIVGNAGNIQVDGVEAEVLARPSEALSIHANLSYDKATYEKYFGSCITSYPTPGSAQPVGSPQKTASSGVACDYAGFPTASAPKLRYNLGGRYEQPWMKTDYRVFATVDVSYTDKQFLDPSLDPRSLQSAYTLINGGVGFQPLGEKWRVDAYVRNLTNKAYYNAASAQPAGALVSAGKSAAGVGLTPNGFVGYYGQPRTFGIELTYNF